MDEINALLDSKIRMQQMSAALQKISVPDSAEKLCDIIYELGSKR
jgi:UDP-N-acetylglucosamine:LPS N-acetylglucosamine transferase